MGTGLCSDLHSTPLLSIRSCKLILAIFFFCNLEFVPFYFIRTLEGEVYDLSIALARRYELPLWEVYMSHLDFLFSESGWVGSWNGNNSFSTLKCLFLRLFHKLMNQYQACLYSFECIFHWDSKYGHEMPQFWHFLQTLWHFWPVVCTRLPLGKC